MERIDRFLREREVLEATSLGRSTLWRLVKDQKFPPPTRLTANRVGWRESELSSWLADPTGWRPPGQVGATICRTQ